MAPSLKRYTTHLQEIGVLTNRTRPGTYVASLITGWLYGTASATTPR